MIGILLGGIMMRAVPVDLERILDEVQVALYELAAARDFAEDGGEPWKVGNRRMEALSLIRKATEGLCSHAGRLLLSLGEAEEGPRAPIQQIQERALVMVELVQRGGGLDLLLDQLEGLREFTGEQGASTVLSARADLMEVRMLLHEVYTNYERIVGFPLSV